MQLPLPAHGSPAQTARCCQDIVLLQMTGAILCLMFLEAHKLRQRLLVQNSQWRPGPVGSAHVARLASRTSCVSVQLLGARLQQLHSWTSYSLPPVGLQCVLRRMVGISVSMASVCCDGGMPPCRIQTDADCSLSYAMQWLSFTPTLLQSCSTAAFSAALSTEVAALPSLHANTATAAQPAVQAQRSCCTDPHMRFTCDVIVTCAFVTAA